MKRSAVVPATVLVATAVGVGVMFGYRPNSSSHAALPATVKVGATAGVGAGASAVGTDQSISGGLGDIQVRVSAKNGKITNVGLARLNINGPQSAQITGQIVPQLIQETLATNGGPIQAVSGATYTSQAYAASLQSALDKIAKTGGTNAALGSGNGNGGVVGNPGGGGDDDGGSDF
jgi:uncharacterized protein with FMN-binding domain